MEIEGLLNANSYLGHSHCSRSRGGIFERCGLPIFWDACLLYRLFAQPKSNEVYEQFTCDSFEKRISFVIKIRDAKGEIFKKNLLLGDQDEGRLKTVHTSSVVKDLPIAMEFGAISPFMSDEDFLTDGKKIVQLPKNFKTITECKSFDAATIFTKETCTMNPIACTNCEEFDSMENCLCPDDEIDHVFADHEMILPIWTKKKIILYQVYRCVLWKSDFQIS